MKRSVFGVLFLTGVLACDEPTQPATTSAIAPQAASVTAAARSNPVTSAVVFTDAADAAGLTYFGGTEGEPVVADLTGDGLVDLIPPIHGNYWSVMVNQGDGTFKPTSSIIPFEKRDRHGCVAANFNGQLGVVCAIGACKGETTCKKQNELWLRTGDGPFADFGTAWGIGDRLGRARHFLALNANDDGRPDLALANEISPSEQSFSKLFLNGGSRFNEVVNSPIRRQIKGAECAAASPSADLLLFCRETGVLAYKKQGGGKFTNITTSVPYRNVPSRDIEFADLDGVGGRNDLIIVSRRALHLWLNRQGVFPTRRYALQEGRDVAVCGLHVYVVQGDNEDYPDIMYRNDGTGRLTKTAVPLPRAALGNGDIAKCVPNWDGSGGLAILVTNGKFGGVGDAEHLARRGPTQLITIE
jgi:hypothetical protein